MDGRRQRAFSGMEKECKEKKTNTIINERYTKKDECDTSNNFMIDMWGMSLSIFTLFPFFQIHSKL